MMMSKNPVNTGAEFNPSIVFIPKIAATFDPTVVNAVQAFEIMTKTTKTGNKKKNPPMASVLALLKNVFINIVLYPEKIEVHNRYIASPACLAFRD
jgi:hypothetical protein